MIPAEWIDQAALRIAPYIRRTLLTNDAERGLSLKWENQQVTGSFKARGALNKVLSLQPWEQKTGLVTASAGNHGQGVALAGNLVGAPVLVFASNHAVSAKMEAMRSLGAEVRFVDGGYELAEATAIRTSREKNQIWVSAYNDGQVIAGQGTIGRELSTDLVLQREMTIVVPTGGGGLLSGIGAALEGHPSRPRLVGVNPEASAFMFALYQHGSQMDVPDLPTLADGLSGAVEAGSLTIPMVRKFADDLVTVTEDEIGHAIAFAWRKYGQKVEGSGAAGLAAVLSGKVKSPAVIIITGGNIQPEVHTGLCSRYSTL